MLFFSHIHTRLSKEEKLRIQRMLRVILPGNVKPIALRRLLLLSYERLGNPTNWLEERGFLSSFQKLLYHFSYLKKDAMSLKEREELQRNPYTIWPTKEDCFLNGDALPFLVSDRRIKKANYLWLFLQKLKPQAIKDWSNWLGINFSIDSERDRMAVLYHHIAQINKKNWNEKKIGLLGLEKGDEAVFLDDIFPDDLNFSPVYWFYRDVLSFYATLHEIEKKQKSYSLEIRELLYFFRIGRLTIAPAPQKDGEKQRWIINKTEEGHSIFSMKESFFPFLLGEKNKEMLF